MSRHAWVLSALVLLGCEATRSAPEDSGDGGPPAVDASGDASPWLVVRDHEIVQASCDGTPYGSEWTATVHARVGCTFDACEVKCLAASDCAKLPFGRCVGSARARCRYGAGYPRMECTNDRDCTLSAGGRCEGLYPRGRLCEYSDVRFNQEERCETDTDCALADEGRCDRAIIHSSCQYEDCQEHQDCPAAAACVCTGTLRRCVPANCRTDGDCEPAQTCQLSPSSESSVEGGLYCTTPADTCRASTDCTASTASPICAYAVGTARWDCQKPFPLFP